MADPLTILALKFLLDQVHVAQQAQAPSVQQENVINLRDAGEVGEAILKCYHPTGRFHSVDVIETPWSRGPQYRARSSTLLRIDYSGGFTRRPYVIVVALVERDDQLKAIIQQDSAVVPANPRCSLDQWVPLERRPE